MKNVRNFYYRLICACLVLAVIGSNTLVFASSPDDIHSQENNFCQELSGIPSTISYRRFGCRRTSRRKRPRGFNYT